MEEKEISLRQATNEVVGNGYLKEYSLDYQTTENNVVIKGTITMAVDEKVSYKLKIYVPKKRTDGSEAPLFTYCDTLIKNAATVNSVSNLLKNNPDLSIEGALARAERLYVMGSIAPFEFLNDKDIVDTILQIKATFVSNPKEGKEFKPGLRFKCEIYINALKAEENEDKQPTGRGIIKATLPLYGGDISDIDVVVPEIYKGDVFRLYEPGITARIYGEFHTEITEKEGEDPQATLAFGVAPEKTNSIESKVELLITGGDAPYGAQNEKSYKKEDIENARVEKIEKLQKNKEEYNSKKEKADAEASPAPIKTGFKFA